MSQREQFRNMFELSHAIRQHRIGQGLTQQELAQKMGVSREWVVRLERGHPRLEVGLVLHAFVTLGLALREEPLAVSEEEQEALLMVENMLAGLAKGSRQ